MKVTKSLKEKVPGTSGTTRNYLLKAPSMTQQQYPEIFSTDYSPKPLKSAKIIMITKIHKPDKHTENYHPLALLEGSI